MTKLQPVTKLPIRLNGYEMLEAYEIPHVKRCPVCNVTTKMVKETRLSDGCKYIGVGCFGYGCPVNMSTVRAAMDELDMSKIISDETKAIDSWLDALKKQERSGG